MMKKENEHISWELLAKDVSGELSSEEHMQLQKELASNPDIENQVKKLWGDTHYAQALKDIDTNTAWKGVKSQISKSKRIHINILSGIAALLLVALATSIFFGWYSTNQTTIISTAQNTQQVTLPDGTIVDLNFDSEISYPTKFDGDTRSVRLSGEAFFAVKRNEAKPFIIETEQLNITVLGTSFNVKAYKNSTNSEVIVSSGKVQVDTRNTDNQVVLEAGDAANYSIHSNKLISQKIYTPNYKAWKTKEIAFDNTPLTDVIKTIEETYHITIELDSTINIDNKVLNATFSQYTIEHVLDAVCSSFNLSYHKKDGIYQISDL